MMAVFAQNPGTLGIGIDENTAAEVTPDQLMVLSEGVVLIFDGRVTHTNASQVVNTDPFALSDINVMRCPPVTAST